MASLYVIREKNTNTYCTSSKHSYFSADLQAAAMFNQRKNADKAVRGMFGEADKGIVNSYGGLTWQVLNEDGTVQYFQYAFLKEYIEALKNSPNSQNHIDRIKWLETEVREQRCEMEVVEVKLVLVDQ